MSDLQPLVFLLCFLTSVTCMLLLVRAWWRTRAGLLLWRSLCFVGVSFNNLFVFLDLILFPNVDLLLYRYASSLLGISVLLFGFIWEKE